MLGPANRSCCTYFPIICLLLCGPPTPAHGHSEACSPGLLALVSLAIPGRCCPSTSCGTGCSGTLPRCATGQRVADTPRQAVETGSLWARLRPTPPLRPQAGPLDAASTMPGIQVAVPGVGPQEPSPARLVPLPRLPPVRPAAPMSPYFPQAADRSLRLI